MEDADPGRVENGIQAGHTVVRWVRQKLLVPPPAGLEEAGSEETQLTQGTGLVALS